jgi:Spy/CpxP family protein refolding chaperone
MTRTILKRAAVFALIAGTALVAGVAAVAHEPGAGFAFHSHEAMTGEDIAAHADMFLQRIYTETNATDAQKAQIDPLVQQAVADMLPMHSGARDFHVQALALLSADTIDRAALEDLRIEHIQAADQASRRLTQAIADIAEVLTPAQRRLLAAHIAEMHGLN